ncbi:vWA domain-containing protein [Peijinzhouia sedimentorum]
MEWFNSFSTFEVSVIGLFCLAYVLYFRRWYQAGKLLKQKGGNWSYKFIIRSIYFALIIVSLLGPTFGVTQKEVESSGKDIYVLVDLSKSMDAHDIAPTRIEKVKFELKKLANTFVTDRLGLIIFGSESFVQCPLTFDNSALNLFIETLNTNLVSSSGTDFGPPLKMALDKLIQEGDQSGKQSSKIIVLISDGEDFGDETSDAIRELRREGVKVFTIGVGTEEGSTIRDGVDVRKDQNGQPVVTRLNSRALKEVAVETGGKYFEINESINETPRLISAIDSVEGEFRQSRQVDVTANKYYYFLAAGLFLMFVDALVSVRLFKL